MRAISLSFCKINFLDRNRVAEIIINDGELLNLKKITELHRVLLNQYSSNSFYLLINKKNSYCYTYKAQLRLADLSLIKAIAIVNYTKISELSTNYVMNFGKKSRIKHKSFYNRESALNWLEHISYTSPFLTL
ncbi:DUF7793 family protein [Pontimicrobium sp. MEBiC01747]|jgi:hypothetical protein